MKTGGKTEKLGQDFDQFTGYSNSESIFCYFKLVENFEFKLKFLNKLGQLAQ